MNKTFHCDSMLVEIFESAQALGGSAAADLSGILRDALVEREQVSIIVATGNSQLSFMKGLRERTDIPWDRVSVFHMDEYLGMSDQHPASFRRYLRTNLVDHVPVRAFYGIAGDAADVQSEMTRYADLLTAQAPIACILGIGENGHLAFNDPPADFATNQVIHVVTLAQAARRQQVGEGYFANLDLVPRQAITLTVPMLLRPDHILAVVPEARKALAVKAALLGPVTPDCPASVLRTSQKVKLYLDRSSASLL